MLALRGRRPLIVCPPPEMSIVVFEPPSARGTGRSLAKMPLDKMISQVVERIENAKVSSELDGGDDFRDVRHFYSRWQAVASSSKAGARRLSTYSGKLLFANSEVALLATICPLLSPRDFKQESELLGRMLAGATRVPA